MVCTALYVSSVSSPMGAKSPDPVILLAFA